MIKKRLSLAISLSFLLASFTFALAGRNDSRADAVQAEAQDQEKRAEEAYKNIQIFKGIPASRLLRAMDFFQTSLGVDCAHCHVPDNLDKDDKQTKVKARKMFAMVRMANDKVGGGRVSCYMCHRGHSRPEPVPPGIRITDEQRKEAERDNRPLDQAYKNIQVLNGLFPAGALPTVMAVFSKSLGVDCTHCHVRGEFEKDDKPAKQTARKMIEMVKEANKYTRVVCYTCHQGQLKPVSFPPRAEPIPPPKAAEIMSSGPLPSVDKVLGRYLRAIGGQAAIKRLKTRVMKGALVSQRGGNAPLEIYAKAPNKRVTHFQNPSGSAYMGYDGEAGWTKSPEQGLRELSGEELAMMRFDSEFYRELKLKELYPRLRVLGSAKLGERDAYVLEAMAGSGAEKWFFDAQSGLLVRVEAELGPAGNKRLVVRELEDYRVVDGVRLPFTTRWTRPGFTWSFRFTEIVHNVPIEDGRFARPSGSNANN